MEHEELYRQAHAFYAVLLRPLNNQLIMDLEVDSEHFLYTPYIPLPGTKILYLNRSTFKKLDV